MREEIFFSGKKFTNTDKHIQLQNSVLVEDVKRLNDRKYRKKSTQLNRKI